jgi:integrase
MGSIRERRKRDGTPSYTAQIIIKRKGRPTYREASTFAKPKQAAAWLKTREQELREEGGIERAQARDLTLADAIDMYIRESRRDLGRTKTQVLRAVKGYDISKLEAAQIGAPDITRFVQQLTATGIKPQTVQNYMSHLSAVFAVAKPMWGIPLDRDAMKDAFAVAKRMGLTGKSEKRDRRPTVAEIDTLMDYFTAQEARYPEMVPMSRIVPFALFSTRRLGEIIRITWEDLDAEGKRVLVRDMKHPGEKIGNDQWVDVPDEAIKFLPPPGTGRIFPVSEDALGANFTRACKFLEIEGLHFHDLRHEGVSRLFEMGWSIPRVATVSGHRSWQSLQRYSHLRQVGDKWKDWKWLQ